MLSQSLLDSWFFFRRHFYAIASIILPIILPIEIISTFTLQPNAAGEIDYSNYLPVMLVGLLAYPIYTVGLIYYLASVIEGTPTNTNHCWQMGKKYWLPCLMLALFAGLTIMLGLMALVLPGILLAIRYSFAEFDLVFNQTQPIDSLRNSWHMTRDYMGTILAGYVLITVGLYTPFWLASKLIERTTPGFWIFDIGSSLYLNVFGTLYTIFAFRVYEIARHKNALERRFDDI